MKIAALSDIHGNLPALEAVLDDLAVWQPDLVVVNGDVINRGPNSAETLALVLSQPNWLLLRGNHEDYISEYLKADPKYHELSHWTYHQIGRKQAEICTQWVDGHSMEMPDGSELRFRHASMQSNRDSVFVDNDEAKLREQIGPAPAVFCTSHTHRPFKRQLGNTAIVNTGSVGTPLDQDRRASYARLIWHANEWHITIPRIPYDYGQAEEDYFDSGYFEGVGAFGHLVFHEWRTASLVIPTWHKRYGAAIEARQIDAETAIRQYLQEEALA